MKKFLVSLNLLVIFSSFSLKAIQNDIPVKNVQKDIVEISSFIEDNTIALGHLEKLAPDRLVQQSRTRLHEANNNLHEMLDKLRQEKIKLCESRTACLLSLKTVDKHAF